MNRRRFLGDAALGAAGMLAPREVYNRASRKVAYRIHSAVRRRF